MNIAVVGLGLIGGSLAKALNSRTGHSVFGADLNEETMLLARLSGAIDAPLTDENLKDMDLVLIAIRPMAAISWAKEHFSGMKKGACVVDMCGVKREVTEKMEKYASDSGILYVGGHPMAGKERGKFQNAAEDLFVGASMILTPGKDTAPDTLENLNNLFTDIGFARIVFTTPDEHDRIIAYTSQLAHIASSAYIKSPEALRQRGFSAGSFRDMTRVAFMDEDMWTELFLLNADYLTEQVHLLIENLMEYEQALENRDADKLRMLLRDGREMKTRAGGN
ncbi:MAG: prephenate dehydrogenase [Clostridia bacterium]|nr:prephenate dehydrogenase [Clostridia bacterium]